MKKTYNLYKVMQDGKLAKVPTLSTVDCTIAEEIDYKDLNHNLWVVEENGTLQLWRRPHSNKSTNEFVSCELVEEKKGTVKATGEHIQIGVCAYDLYTVDFAIDTECVKSTAVDLPVARKADSTLVEYDGNFSSTAEVRGYVLDNRDEYEGYIVRSNNCWDGDTIYRWQELDNGRIIWRKTKA